MDNTRITENSGPNSVIGTFSIEESDDIEFSFAQGVGDRDNPLFAISGNQLIAPNSFDFETSNTFTIRVRGKINSGDEMYECAFIIEVENINEDITFSDCEETVTNLSFALNDVAYIDLNTIVAIGQGGVIMKSHDSGSHWVQINSGVKRHLQNIQFVNNKTGYIIGDYGVLLKTENGGEDWFPLEMPAQDYPYPHNFYFVDDQKGFVFGDEGKIFKTTNGGISWEEDRLSYSSLAAAHFIDDLNGFICGSSILAKTEDGGNSWSSIELDDLGWNLKLVDIQFLSESIGFVAGGNGEIYKTSDGGTSWKLVGTVFTDYLTDIYFLDEQYGYATGGWSSSNIFKTEDGGITWTEQREYSYYQNTISLDFSPDHTKGCAVGYGSSLGSTGESGRTILMMNNDEWTLQSSLQQAIFRSASYVDDTTAFIFGEHNLKTINGGLTWNKLDIPNTKDIVQSFFLDKNTGFAMASYSLYKTIDGGNSWSKIEGGPWSLKNIYFYNQDLGFVFGYGGAIHRSTDGGNNWEEVSGVTTSRQLKISSFLILKKVLPLLATRPKYLLQRMEVSHGYR